MSKENSNGTADWLKQRDKWMRELIASSFVSRNGKLAGIYLALRLSAKQPSTWPKMETMAKELGISTRQAMRAVKELEGEHFIVVERQHRQANEYRLAM